MQGAWGLLLGRLTGREDVVFGTTVSGRSSEVDGVAEMIGLFANTLPVRLRWRPGQPALDVLAAAQAAQSDLTAHHHVGLAELQRLAGVAELFDTLLVFENYPLDVARTDPAGTLEVAGVTAYGTGHYPLALIVVPGERLTIHLEYDSARVAAETVRGHRREPGPPAGRARRGPGPPGRPPRHDRLVPTARPRPRGPGRVAGSHGRRAGRAHPRRRGRARRRAAHLPGAGRVVAGRGGPRVR